jgi:iron complex transport system substrate-binding protein
LEFGMMTFHPASLGAMIAVLLGVAHPAMAQSQRPESIVSLNMCTDQLLLDLAPSGQIRGLSPFARDGARSWLAAKAEGLSVLSGTAEEVVLMRPDLVVAGRFTKRATREFIRSQNIPLEEFDVVRTVAEAKQQIARFGVITGATEKATLRNAELDEAAAALKGVASSSKLRVLPLSRRGWVSGRETLMSDLLMQAGLVNAATELGWRSGGFVTLEAIVKLRPDAILISRERSSAEDQGSALLLHPAIQELFPPERRIIVSERLTVCGGPMLVEAMRALADQISRLKPRDAALR